MADSQSETQRKQRDTKDIQQEFLNLSARAGSLQYEIECKQADLKALNQTMRSLTSEYVAAQQLEAKIKSEVDKAKAAEATKIEETKKPELKVIKNEGEK